MVYKHRLFGGEIWKERKGKMGEVCLKSYEHGDVSNHSVRLLLK